MARRKRRKSDSLDLIAVLLGVAVLGYLAHQWTATLIASALLVLTVGFCAWSISQRRQRLRALQLADVDGMSGEQFEHYVAALLKHQGFETRVTRLSGDFGVDIVAQKGGLKYAVQTKRYSKPVD